MGDPTRLDSFDLADSFLRHIDRKRFVSEGVVSWEVFRARSGESALSFTFQDEGLRTPGGIGEYRAFKRLPSGDQIGLCRLTYEDLTQSLRPPLPPRCDAVASDERYGHLHCITDLPRDEIHMEMMAKLATRNGVVAPFERCRLGRH